MEGDVERHQIEHTKKQLQKRVFLPRHEDVAPAETIPDGRGKSNKQGKEEYAFGKGSDTSLSAPSFVDLGREKGFVCYLREAYGHGISKVPYASSVFARNRPKSATETAITIFVVKNYVKSIFHAD